MGNVGTWKNLIALFLSRSNQRAYRVVFFLEVYIAEYCARTYGLSSLIAISFGLFRVALSS